MDPIIRGSCMLPKIPKITDLNETSLRVISNTAAFESPIFFYGMTLNAASISGCYAWNADRKSVTRQLVTVAYQPFPPAVNGQSERLTSFALC